ncbi:acyl-CoA thioesterase [Arcobacter sp. HD9-500m-PIT-SAG02]|nr:acyl-CoA thioesterase [Arcobacter sp. HD9-500m-PIT-SAG02]
MEYGTQRMVMYPHLNAAGILFGGVTLSWIVEDAIIFATNMLETNKIAAVKMSEVSFQSAANIGDILLSGVELVRTGTTSITVKCELRNKTTDKVLIQVDEIIIVALDFNKQPTKHKFAK